jgi:hypothetical protein
MGAKPSSAVQQSTYLETLDKYIDIDESGNRRVDANGKPRNFRDRFALCCDDIACGSNCLEELQAMFEALVSCFKRSGIQVKASKVKFGVSKITFHNYRQSLRKPTYALSVIWAYPSTSAWRIAVS